MPFTLKPCPFCGGQASPNKVTYSDGMVAEQDWDQRTFFGVNCVVCGVNNVGLVGSKTPDDAALKWNTRKLED